VILERAMGIEPTSEAWEATQNTTKRSIWRLFCFFQLSELDSDWSSAANRHGDD
jgi:hypothetical protein